MSSHRGRHWMDGDGRMPGNARDKRQEGDWHAHICSGRRRALLYTAAPVWIVDSTCSGQTAFERAIHTLSWCSPNPPLVMSSHILCHLWYGCISSFGLSFGLSFSSAGYKFPSGIFSYVFLSHIVIPTCFFSSHNTCGQKSRVKWILFLLSQLGSLGLLIYWCGFVCFKKDATQFWDAAKNHCTYLVGIGQLDEFRVFKLNLMAL